MDLILDVLKSFFLASSSFFPKRLVSFLILVADTAINIDPPNRFTYNKRDPEIIAMQKGCSPPSLVFKDQDPGIQKKKKKVP